MTNNEFKAFVSRTDSEGEIKEPKKRGAKKKSTQSLMIDGVEYVMENADKKFTLLLEPSELEAIEKAFLVFMRVAPHDQVLKHYVETHHKGKWQPVLNRNQMIKHALRLYFKTLNIDLDVKPLKHNSST